MPVHRFPTTDTLLPDAVAKSQARPVEAGTSGPATAAPAKPAPAAAAAKPAPYARLDALGEHLMHTSDHGLVLDETARLYPHIVNKLAVFWNDAEALDAYLNKLLFADRPDRAGLEFKVASELAEVRARRVAQLKPPRPVR